MKVLRVFGSRWILVPLAVAVGVLIGLRIAMSYARGVVAANWANQAAIFANIAARVDAGEPAAARDNARQQMTIAVDSLAHMSNTPEEARKYNNALRNVSTYLAIEPAGKLHPDTLKLLSAYPPMTGAELESSVCEAGVCRLARRAATQPVVP